ncbi:MAG TPA: translation initiation factor IF-2 [Planctomycetes bacterium]|nr:translation initiation factor IF-2 [Planctomycetota bacterium]HIK61949.1 translation initiation factor IF-2 [Planctomycetota bacterium]
MSDKVRIHDLAKRYGMPGKDLAARLRDCGFSQAKSHMSALDTFELMQAEGILAANGITPSVSEEELNGGESVGGLKIKRKTKKKKAEETAPDTPSPSEPEGSPEEGVEAKAAPNDEAQASPESPLEEDAAAPGAPGDDEGDAGVKSPAPAPEAEEGGEAEVAAENQDPEAKQEPQAEDAPASTGPRGKVVGFIDPTKFQTSERARPESRRLKSRDDFTPDVHPTFTHGAKGARAAAGPRGDLTAAELRQREQGRFLRRSGRPQTGGRGGARRGRGRTGGAGPDKLTTDSPHAGETVAIAAPVTIMKLAEAIKLKSSLVQKRALEQKLGMFTLNTLLDDDTASLLANEFEVELDIRQDISAEEQHLAEMHQKRSDIEDDSLESRSPTVAFLGHVDHGKTTLIDKIRETKVADNESGGITQHIGAYRVQTSKGHSLTIVDTPGHQAFTSMRARGAKAVDIVVLVVAGDDGVKPSTEEAINHAKVAKTPIVVALNKMDKPGFNANASIQQLMGHELVPEQFGGATAMFETSAITGEGIDEMLEHIFLMAEAELDLRAHPTGPAAGVVLEAEIQQGRGIVAHLLIQDGTLNRGDIVLAGEGYGKVKSVHDDRGQTIQSAGPSVPVEVTGLAAIPGVGDPFYVIETLAKAKEIAGERERKNRAVALAASGGSRKDLDAILGSSPVQEVEAINLIVRADVQGSAEVIRHEVDKLKHEEVEVQLLHSGVGPITESDVDLATTSGALMVAFHVGVNGKARQQAERSGLEIRRYEVIYELLDDLHALMEGALSPEYQEEIIGHVEIRRLFKSSKIGLIAGSHVIDGRITRNSSIRLLRDGTVVHSGSLASLRRESDDAKEVREGFDCGIVIKNYGDIHEGDIVEAFTLKEVKRTLEGSRA